MPSPTISTENAQTSKLDILSLNQEFVVGPEETLLWHVYKIETF